MHVDAQPAQDLGLLAIADHHAGIVGEHGEAQAGQLGASKIGLPEPGALPFVEADCARKIV